MSLMTAGVADIAAITLLVLGVYYVRHFRRDLVLAYVALNVGVMAVTAMLAGSGAGVGLGLGLFGILSIIRLRSDAITQEEVAYYFVALAMGLANGIHPDPVWVAPAISFALVAVMYAADHPRFAARTRRQMVTLDRAYPRESDLRASLEQLLGAQILRVSVSRLDLVRDVTVADVRFRTSDVPSTRARRPGMAESGVAEPVLAGSS